MTFPSGQDIDVNLADSVARIAAGDLGAADALLVAVLAVQPRHAVALYLSGVTQFERGQWRQAEDFFRQALAISPGQAKVCLHLAQCLRAQGRAAEALACCRAVLNSAPDHVEAWLELAQAQQESGAMRDAEASYRRILGRGQNPEAVLHFSRLLNQTGRAREAEALLRNILADAGHG